MFDREKWLKEPDRVLTIDGWVTKKEFVEDAPEGVVVYRNDWEDFKVYVKLCMRKREEVRGMNVSIETAFKTMASKGPVNHESSQRAFDRMYSMVRHLITEEEHMYLMIARGHSTIGEGRNEWDGICKKIRMRLVKEKIFKP